MSTIHAMHARGLEGQILALPDGRLGLVTKACHVRPDQIVKTADHDSRVVAVDSPVGGGHTHLQFAGYGFLNDTETLRSAELLVVITGGSAA